MNENETAVGADNETKVIDFSKITITNRFMFPLVMSHKEIAKPFIEAALGIKIYDLKDPEQEKTEQVGIFSKSVRYDVYAQETGKDGKVKRSFDLEMQMEDTKELPKRARYYQSIHDTHELRKGAMYSSLKDQYVLFICPEDIFKEGLPIYSFQNYATENKKLALNDRTFKNF
ncbi:MAG: PD-(D/E)XK nuclease family transposase [Fibrobacter sp.]|nr:PD-(D/E)XK nuclease family transposase [Fibrobacter sp.]